MNRKKCRGAQRHRRAHRNDLHLENIDEAVDADAAEVAS